MSSEKRDEWLKILFEVAKTLESPIEHPGMDTRHFPVETMARFLGVFKNTNLPIVSVGSGNGQYEWHLKNKHGLDDIQWYLVDPQPEKYRIYCPDESIPPDYALVQDLVKAKPELVGNCVMFLCWPSPGKSKYDIEAIKILQPRGVVLVYETIGCAGGTQLHHWLRGMEESDTLESIAPQGLEMIDTSFFPEHEYVSKKKRITRYGEHSTIGLMIYRILMLVRKDYADDFNLDSLPNDEEIVFE